MASEIATRCSSSSPQRSRRAADAPDLSLLDPPNRARASVGLKSQASAYETHPARPTGRTDPASDTLESSGRSGSPATATRPMVVARSSGLPHGTLGYSSCSRASASEAAIVILGVSHRHEAAVRGPLARTTASSGAAPATVLAEATCLVLSISGARSASARDCSVVVLVRDRRASVLALHTRWSTRDPQPEVSGSPAPGHVQSPQDRLDRVSRSRGRRFILPSARSSKTRKNPPQCAQHGRSAHPHATNKPRTPICCLPQPLPPRRTSDGGRRAAAGSL
jgi:hypothetical protein